jgi:hypothetical protein
MWAISASFKKLPKVKKTAQSKKKLPKVNDHPLGENSTHLGPML